MRRAAGSAWVAAYIAVAVCLLPPAGAVPGREGPPGGPLQPPGGSEPGPPAPPEVPEVPEAPEEPDGPPEEPPAPPPEGPEDDPVPPESPDPPEPPAGEDGGGGGGVACGGDVLCAAEAAGVARAAAAAADDDRMTIAVVDRLGNVLALYRKPAADPARDDEAIGLARTAAFFSNDQAPLSSRTVRFVSGIHFPPGVARTPNAALYGIENTNRGCLLDPALERGRDVADGRSLAGILGPLPCHPGDTRGCRQVGVETGKPDVFDTNPQPGNPKTVAVNPGGVPIFRPRDPLDPRDGPPTRRAVVIGGVGVAGVPAAVAELAAFSGAFGGGSAPVPQFPLPAPGNVFIDGIRLPFVETLARPPGVGPGAANGAFVVGPVDGSAARDGWLLGPRAGARLSAAEVQRVVEQSVAAALRTRAVIRLPLGSRARMVIAVADVDGRLLALYRMPDATVFSIDVAASKARNVVYFSADPAAPLDLDGVPPFTAITNRTISFGAQPLYPPGIDGTAPGPFFDLFRRDTDHPCSQGTEPAHPHQSGVVFFPGSIPLYQGNDVVGGLGISGDGVEQDDYVSLLGAEGFLPPPEIRANEVFVRGVRLPFLKLPRNPEG